MIDMNQYANPERIEAFCREIEMPDLVTDHVMHHVKSLDCVSIQSAFQGLFSVNTGGESYKIIEQYCSGDSGLKALTVYLIAALVTRQRQKGISYDIYIDTMKAFTRFVNEHFTSYGIYGFDRGFWTYRQISSVLFRLGTLEFEMRSSYNRYPELALSEEPVLSVHIPSDAVLTKQELDKSYELAEAFFREHFGYDYKLLICSSWLLSPILKKMLPPQSKIIQFQSDYSIRSYDENDNSFMIWVYKREYEDLKDLPETTSLAKAMKEHLLNGGKIGSAFGLLKSYTVSINQNE